MQNEKEFKEVFVQGFMDAYNMAVKFGAASRQVSIDDIFRVANQRADQAWRTQQNAEKNDS